MQCGRVEGEEESVASINRTFQEWRHAIAAADLDKLEGLVTEDGEFWSNMRPPLVGPARLREAFTPFFETYAMDQEFRCVELVASGHWAFARGTEVNELTPKEGGETMVQRQRAFSVLERGPDGVWRFARGMTNVPPQDSERPNR